MLLAVIFFASSCTKHEMASEMQTQNGSSPLSYTTSELPIGGAKDSDGSSTTKTGGQLKSKLLTNYPNKATQINQLFTSYGY